MFLFFYIFNISGLYGLGSAVTEDDKKITGAKLPSTRQVLRCYLSHRKFPREKGQSKRETAKIVLEEIVPFYERSSIPLMTEKKAIDRIIKYADKHVDIYKISSHKRSLPSAQKKLAEEEANLEKTFKLWPDSAKSLLNNEEDILFLESMETDRVATMGGADTITRGIVERRIVREQEAEARKAKEREKAGPSKVIVTNDIEAQQEVHNEFSSEDSGDEFTEVLSESKDQSSSKGTAVFIPANILTSPSLTALATRLKMTPAQQAAYTEALLQEVAVDKTKIKIHTSYSFTDKQRRKVNNEIVEKELENWEPPEFASLHWDSKIMPSLDDKYKSEERLVISLGTQDDIKLLEIPSYLTGSGRGVGEIVSEKTMELLNS